MRQLHKKLLMGGGLLALIGVVACTDFSHPPDALGHIKILVVDSATNAGVNGITATLFLADGTTQWRALVTSADGGGEFGLKDGGVIPGTFLVFIDLSGKGYQLAAGETNYKSAQVIVGQTTTANFKLHKGVVRPPGS